MLTDDLRAKLNALVEQIEQDAFLRGWNAAVEQIMSAAANAPKSDTFSAIGTVTDANVEPQRKASYGVVPALIGELLDEAEERGIRPPDVVARGRQRGEAIAESSVRQRLRKMKIAREVRNERGRWFRVRPAIGSVEQETGDADTSPEDRLCLNDGGFHAAA